MASALEMERQRKLMALGVKPYEGSEPYIFISYAHKDFDRVIPTVKALIDQGFRVWYDEGIDPGTEWDANIADHVENCYCMLSFISANYLASNNCLDELSYARDLNKEQLFVYLEELKLPGRLALRFGRLQAIFQHTYAKQEQFYEKLFFANVLEAAIGDVPAGSATYGKAISAARTPDMQAISELFEYEQDEDGITITKIRDKMRTAVEIPWGVTSIGDWAFYDCYNLASVTIPDGVTSIGECAFYECTSLTSITIPDTVTSIGTDAFSVCTSLTNITIPDSVTSIERGAFHKCSSLESITIPDGVTSIGECAFRDCSNLSSITIPESVTSIGDWAFRDCSNLSSITIPESVTSIGDLAFMSCMLLTSITIPDSVISIGERAFWGCIFLKISAPKGSCAERYASRNNISFNALPSTRTIDLQAISELFLFEQDGEDITITGVCDRSGITVEIPWGVTSIGEGAFFDCENLKNVTIPDSVTNIGKAAFLDCEKLKDITIPDSVTSIGDYAFYGCYGLYTLTIPRSVTSIGEHAFDESNVTIYAEKGSFAEHYAMNTWYKFQPL